MVQARKNWAQITGRIVAVDDGGGSPGFVTLQVSLDDISDQSGFANMLKGSEGRTIEVTAPADRVEQLALNAGEHLAATVQVVGPGRTFADPDSIKRGSAP